MARAGPEALARLTETIRQLRAIPQVRERSPGVFHLLGQAFVHFHDSDGALHADLRKMSGSGFDAFAVDEPSDRRRLVDEARRRAAKIVDD